MAVERLKLVPLQTAASVRDIHRMSTDQRSHPHKPPCVLAFERPAD